MKFSNLSRRQFLQQTATVAGAALLSPALLPAARAAARRTAADQVTLGKTGLKLSRLGMGTGSNSGKIQRDLGQEAFNKLVRYAYDQGITYFDCAQGYKTFDWIAGAIKGLPREKLFLQTKIPGKPENVLEAVDKHRKMFNTDYLDSVLIHCMIKDGWTDEWKRIMDGFNEAQSKQWIRAKGVSCHSLPALRTAAATDWTQVHLVRVNPQAIWIDGPEQAVNKSGTDIAPVIQEIKTMHAKGRGVIGMKLIGNGEFTKAEDRERAMRYAMSHPEINAVVVGFKSTAEIDETIGRMNRALVEV